MANANISINPRDAARQLQVTVRVKGLRWWKLWAHVGLSLVRLGIWFTGARSEVERDDVAR